MRRIVLTLPTAAPSLRLAAAALAAAALVPGAAPAAAQDAPANATEAAASAEGMPDGWMRRFDRPSATPDMAVFRPADEGWRITTGRAGWGIFWEPAHTAAGEYDVAGEFRLLAPAEHPEAFGLFLGGRDLDGLDQAYVYFLVRQSGEFLIKRRAGDDTVTLVDWTAHDAVPAAASDGPTDYDLAVSVRGDEVAFQVNGATVHTLPREGLATDGQVGLRVNHRLDLEVKGPEVR